MQHAFPPESFQRENRTTFSKYRLFPRIFQWNARNFLVNEKRTECYDLLKRLLRLHFDNSPLYKQGNWAELTLAKTSGTVTIWSVSESHNVQIAGINEKNWWDSLRHRGITPYFLRKTQRKMFFLLTALMFGPRTPRRDTNMAFPYKAL